MPFKFLCLNNNFTNLLFILNFCFLNQTEEEKSREIWILNLPALVLSREIKRASSHPYNKKKAGKIANEIDKPIGEMKTQINQVIQNLDKCKCLLGEPQHLLTCDISC